MSIPRFFHGWEKTIWGHKVLKNDIISSHSFILKWEGGEQDSHENLYVFFFLILITINLPRNIKNVCQETF